MQRRSKLSGCALLFLGMLSCSHSAASSLTPAELEARAVDAFLNPDRPIGSIPSSLSGVWRWSFYSGALGTVAIGEDDGLNPKVEVALLTDEHGTVLGAAYAADSSAIQGETITAAITADLQRAASVGGQARSLKLLGGLGGGADGGTSLSGGPDGGVALTGAPVTLVTSCVGALATGFGSETSDILGGIKSIFSCPPNLLTFAGCAAGGVVGGAAQGVAPIADACLPSGSVDQAGIVESSTMMLAGGPVAPILDGYNREDPFAIEPSPYAPTFASRLASFDAYDHSTDWQPAQATAWVQRMSSGNYLVVDTSMPCDYANPHTYLEIERAALTGGAHSTCGGRMPNENAIDVTLNYLIRGPAASATDANAIHDDVSQPTQWSSSTFPYLAEMNGG